MISGLEISGFGTVSVIVLEFILGKVRKEKIILLKQGRPPQESERGPYAVVDERCEDTTLE